MKVLALNGSPRMKSSSTYHILDPFLGGMRAAGAETEVIHLRGLDLKPCIGCYACWARTPGVCIHQDAMAEAIERYNQADMVIFGTPLYHFSMSGIMKTFIDRLLPRHEPWLIPHPGMPGMTGHPRRWPGPAQMFLVSPCGFPEFENFDALVYTFKHFARMHGLTYVGEILRPYAEPLSRHSLQHLFTSYYDHVRQAGKVIVEEGRIPDALQAALRNDLFPGGKMVAYQLAEAYWNQQMDHYHVPEPLRHTAPLLAEDLDRIPMAPGTADATPPQHAGARSVSNELPRLFTHPRAAALGDTETSGIPNETTQARQQEATATKPLTFRDALSGMTAVFDAEAVGALIADIQFRGTGQEPGDYYLHIEDGACTFHDGIAASPALTIHTPSEVWLAICRGELEGTQAFMEGGYRAEGDFSLLMKLREIFKQQQQRG